MTSPLRFFEDSEIFTVVSSQNKQFRTIYDTTFSEPQRGLQIVVEVYCRCLRFLMTQRPFEIFGRGKTLMIDLTVCTRLCGFH